LSKKKDKKKAKKVIVEWEKHCTFAAAKKGICQW